LEIEQDARRAKSSIREEIETRLRKSYLSDAVYCNSQMAAMFHEMVQVAESVNSKVKGSFFEDFHVFSKTRELWDEIIIQHMPFPNDDEITKLRGDWVAGKTEARRTLVKFFSEERLPQGPPLTPRERLVEALIGPIARKPAGIGGGAIAGATAGSVSSESAGPLPGDELESVFGKTVPLMAKILAPLLDRSPAEFAVGQLGSLVRVMEALRPSGGTLKDAAKGVSRLAEVLADALEEATASEISDPERDADKGDATVGQ
jgi:hypothetical protein